MKKDKMRIKSTSGYSEEQNEIKSFITIVIVLILIIVGVYFFNRACVSKDLINNNDEEKEPVAGEINYSTTLIGNMLNKIEDEYFVFIYDTSEFEAMVYNSLANVYSNNEDALPIYFADLSNELNKKFYDKDNINANTTNFEEFRVGDVTLLKIVNGKIKNSYTNIEDIKTVLKATNND